MPDNEPTPNQSAPEQPAPAPSPAPNAAAPPPVQNSTPNSAPQTQKGYAKRPLWQWVVLYIVIAIILYGAVYLLFFSGHSATGTGGYNY